VTHPYPDDVAAQPLARAVLAKLAATRGNADPLGSLARTVLRGEAVLRTTVTHPWHGAGLDAAFTDALDAHRNLSAQDRQEIDRAAQQLREADRLGLLNSEQTDSSSDTGTGRR
jgi:hypothetical protein